MISKERLNSENICQQLKYYTLHKYSDKIYTFQIILFDNAKPFPKEVGINAFLKMIDDFDPLLKYSYLVFTFCPDYFSPNIMDCVFRVIKWNK